MRAPRARACSSDSRTRIPAPSPLTNPARSWANGRDGVPADGSPSASARMAANDAMIAGVTTASAPPARATSTRPYRMRSTACPMASVPEAQALVTVRASPVMCRSSETWDAACEGTVMGVVRGETPRGPLSRSFRSPPTSTDASPRMAPRLTPTRSGSSPLSRVPPSAYPASAHASRAASTANCAARFIRRAAWRGSSPAGSTGTLPATRTGSPSNSSSANSRMPCRPSSSPCHNAPVPTPSGVTAPSPVTTTRRAPAADASRTGRGRWPTTLPSRSASAAHRRTSASVTAPPGSSPVSRCQAPQRRTYVTSSASGSTARRKLSRSPSWNSTSPRAGEVTSGTAATSNRRPATVTRCSRRSASSRSTPPSGGRRVNRITSGEAGCVCVTTCHRRRSASCGQRASRSPGTTSAAVTVYGRMGTSGVSGSGS